MKFSTRSEYGLRALAQIGRLSCIEPASLAKIAKKEGISKQYLEHLIAKLKKAKILKSAKGIKGGYRLSRPPSRITVLEIIEALEGIIKPYNCLTSQLRSQCGKETCCPKVVWQKIQKSLTKTLKEITLVDLVK